MARAHDICLQPVHMVIIIICDDSRCWSQDWCGDSSSPITTSHCHPLRTKKFLLVAKWERHNLDEQVLVGCKFEFCGRLTSHYRYKHVIFRTPNFALKDKLLVVE